MECPNCKYHQAQKLYTFRRGTVIKCKRCDLAFTNSQRKEDFQRVNSIIYSKSYCKNYIKQRDKLEKRINQRANEITKYIQQGKLLDIGCGTGLFLSIFRKISNEKWKLYGLDINKENVKFARTLTKINIFAGNVQQAKYKTKMFEVITVFDVLEHDINMKKTLKEIKRILKPGGLLVIQCPNYKSLMAKICAEDWDWWQVPDHAIHFSPKTLTKVLTDSGFKVMKISTWEDKNDFVLNVVGMLKHKMPKILVVNRIISYVARLMLPKVYFLNRLLNKYFYMGGLILVYATNY